MKHVHVTVAAAAMMLMSVFVSRCHTETAPAEAASPGSDGAASEASDELVSVGVLAPERRSLQQTTTQPATVSANFQAEIYAKVAGYLTGLRVDIGDNVEAGDVLGHSFCRPSTSARLPNMSKFSSSVN